jgi:tRNA 2-thiouridine synthesizing protein B
VTLHTVNKSPFTHGCLASCLRLVDADDEILLLEDGVYAALPNQMPDSALPRVRVLAEDLAARGLLDRIEPRIERVDYAGFVRLTERHGRVLAWY